MTRGMYIFCGALCVFLGLVYLAFVVADVIDSGDLQHDAVEVEGEVLRVHEGVDYVGRQGATQVRRCSADVRIDLEGRTHESRVDLTVGECDAVHGGQHLTVVVRPSDPTHARRTFDPELSGPPAASLAFKGVLVALFVVGGVVLLVLARKAPRYA